MVLAPSDWHLGSYLQSGRWRRVSEMWEGTEERRGSAVLSVG